MSASRFIDTNVVVYAYDSSDVVKQAKAQQTLTDAVARGDGAISTQVFGEFFHTVVIRKKLMDGSDAQKIISTLEAGLEVHSITPPLVREAVMVHQRHQLSYWDSLIIATARHSGCAEVVSEDMNPGQDYGGVVVLNPFKP
ncbi:PIN domain-containing protein [Prosthecobacter sp.]|uniref:PIN domain-containing protein n=1 Tax=Prosthecobacter sp. TaxID=1965333 RepID=UPI0037839539